MNIFIGVVLCFLHAFVAWFMGGMITGIIFSEDFPNDHKVCWFISGNLFALLLDACLLFL